MGLEINRMVGISGMRSERCGVEISGPKDPGALEPVALARRCRLEHTARCGLPGDMREAVGQMPRHIEIVVIPEMNEVCAGIGQLEYPASNVAERARRRCLVDDAHSRMIEPQLDRVLVVDQQRRRCHGLLEEAGQRLAGQGIASTDSHQAIELHGTAITLDVCAGLECVHPRRPLVRTGRHWRAAGNWVKWKGGQRPATSGPGPGRVMGRGRHDGTGNGGESEPEPMLQQGSSDR